MDVINAGDIKLVMHKSASVTLRDTRVSLLHDKFKCI